MMCWFKISQLAMMPQQEALPSMLPAAIRLMNIVLTMEPHGLTPTRLPDLA